MWFNRQSHLELPTVFGSETEIKWREKDFVAAAANGDSNMVRPVIVTKYDLGDTALQDYLSSATEMFETIAEQCGARVVEHTWGLYELPSEIPHTAKEYVRNLAGATSEGFIVAAEVGIVPQSTTPTGLTLEELEETLEAHSKRRGAYADKPWRDARADQFVVTDGTDTDDLILVDIDPLFGRPKVFLRDLHTPYYI